MSYTFTDILPRILTRLHDPLQSQFATNELILLAQDAGDELQLDLELNGVLVLEKISTVIVVPIGTLSLGTASPTSLIPVDMLEPQRMEERLHSSQDMFMPMIARQWEPDILPTDALRYWAYREEDCFFVGATTVRDVKIYYLKRLIDITTADSPIAVNNSQLFMINKTAALAARFIGENETRADELDAEAERDMQKLLGISAKSKQRTRTRRRPFTLTGRRNWA